MSVLMYIQAILHFTRVWPYWQHKCLPCVSLSLLVHVFVCVSDSNYKGGLGSHLGASDLCQATVDA